MTPIRFATLVAVFILAACGAERRPVDLILRGGTVYDGSGTAPRVADVAITDGRIEAIGDLSNRQEKAEVNAAGLAVAPGFINMLSWSVDSLIVDPRSQSDLRQGVTLEVFGEGWSMGPLSEAQKRESKELQTHIKYDITWTTLGEYLDFLQKRGIACNVASFVGATTVRGNVLGNANRAPSPREMETMRDLVRKAMEEGALGVGSALIYAPAFYAKTDELVELARAAAPYGGMYISHMRSEGNALLEGIDELITIAREAKVPAEIYHLKAAGKQNWGKLDAAIAKVEAAQREGLHITANMYSYTAGATGLDAAMPPWVQEGGFAEWRKRLMDPATRARVLTEMNTPSNDWENLYLSAGADGMLLLGFRKDQFAPLIGKTLAEVARIRGKTAAETAIDLVIEDESRVETAYFLMSEDNVRRQVALPWVSFGSDAPSQAPEGVFLKMSTHPRAYGNFARVLGHYVREEKLISLQQAIHRMTALPAGNLKLRERGLLRPGYWADVVVFDPATIADHANYESPQVYATGMKHVFVNGVQVLEDGESTGRTPGQVVRGPGWSGWRH